MRSGTRATRVRPVPDCATLTFAWLPPRRRLLRCAASTTSAASSISAHPMHSQVSRALVERTLDVERERVIIRDTAWPLSAPGAPSPSGPCNDAGTTGFRSQWSARDIRTTSERTAAPCSSPDHFNDRIEGRPERIAPGMQPVRECPSGMRDGGRALRDVPAAPAGSATLSRTLGRAGTASATRPPSAARISCGTWRRAQCADCSDQSRGRRSTPTRRGS